MKLKDYVAEVEQLTQKALVYKELQQYLKKFIRTDMDEAELFIPIGSGTLSPQGTIEYEKTVPENVIADVLLEVEAAEEELQTELRLKLDQTIG